MFESQKLLEGKGKYLYGLTLLLLISVICVAFSMEGSDDFDIARIFTLGSVLFDAEKRQLIINKKTIDLTGTETRLLLSFALPPNETIERSRLQKEIWEDGGVIVGRSLDMFISKLRKN